MKALTGRQADYFAWLRLQALARLRRTQQTLIRMRRVMAAP